MGTKGERGYVVYRNPDGDIYIDWNNTLWRSGYPYWPKHKCVELERGVSVGGEELIELYTRMKEKYCDGLI